MKQCVFCGRYLDKSSQESYPAEEHAFPKWLQKRLGVTGVPILSTRANAHTNDVVFEREHTLNTFVAGSVCKGCNCGWMSRLENEVQPILDRLFREYKKVWELSLEDQDILRNWAFKTVLATISAIPGASLVTAPTEQFRQMAERGTVPHGVHVVASHLQTEGAFGLYTPAKHWHVGFQDDELVGMYTVVLHFGNVVLYVMYVPVPHHLALDAFKHTALAEKQSQFEWYEAVVDPGMSGYNTDMELWDSMVAGVIITADRQMPMTILHIGDLQAKILNGYPLTTKRTHKSARRT